MVDPQGPQDGPSWADIWELRRARRRSWELGSHRPAPNERDGEAGYSYEEVLAEIRLIVADTERLLREDPTSGMGALGAAEEVARLRDDDRLRARGQEPLGDFSAWFVGWLIRRADGGDLAAALEAASLAADGSAEPPVLGRELREYVRGYLDGSISGEEDTRRQKHPRAKLVRQAEDSLTTSEPVASGPVAERAAVTLTAMLGDALSKPDAQAAWEVFERFALLPFAPAAPERLDEALGDLLLFEWGVYAWGLSGATQETFLVELVRQFSVVAEDGEYERMEQVHCSIAFDAVPELRQLGQGTVWSNEDRSAWFGEVERSQGFIAIRTGRPIAIHVDHGRL